MGLKGHRALSYVLYHCVIYDQFRAVCVCAPFLFLFFFFFVGRKISKRNRRSLSDTKTSRITNNMSEWEKLRSQTNTWLVFRVANKVGYQTPQSHQEYGNRDRRRFVSLPIWHEISFCHNKKWSLWHQSTSNHDQKQLKGNALQQWWFSSGKKSRGKSNWKSSNYPAINYLSALELANPSGNSNN